MFPDVQVAEKANGNGQSVQGRADTAPWEMVPGFSIVDGTLLISIAQVADEIPGWSIYPAARDRYLRMFWKKEPHLAGTIYSRNAKMRALAYKIKAPGPRSQKRFQDLFGFAEFGRGAADLFGKVQIDLDTQDNGAFVELIGAGRADRPLRGPVLQLAHLDSANCWRTFDPEFPVIYTNPYTGQYHKIHTSRILSFSSCTQPDELARGIGFCGVSRALLLAQVMRDIAIFKHEKISGRFKRAVIYGNGYTPKGFSEAMEQADEKTDAIGFTRFMQIPVLLSQKDNAALNLLNLASLPDGFDEQTDTTLYMYSLALAFGMDAREIWPATASGATKADATIQHQKALGKGWGDLITTLERGINWSVLPEGVELEFDNQDDEQDRQVAEIHQLQIMNEDFLVKNGTLSPAEGRAVLISQGVIDPTTLENVAAPVLADDTAPVSLDEEMAVTEQNAPPETPPPETPPVAPPIGTKEDTPAEKPPEPEKPVIKGSPLPSKEATKVEPFTEGEIADLFDTYAKLKGKVKPDA